jgi:beta-glucosidase/6-phospho-beta-glucosidase/beta-galactosidase
MIRTLALLAAAVLSTATAAADDSARCFPADFMFGSATAAYQVEGAWNEGGRTPSVWDEFCREREDVACANVADDFYHRYRSDLALMQSSGLSSFRFSVSWSRLMNYDAETKRMKANPEGVAFYHALLDEIRARGMEPVLTLYHWDLPVELHHELSPPGWLNEQIVDHFVAYASLAFAEFGAKVKFWTTFNEPLTFTVAGYGTGASAPGLTNSTTNVYTSAHYVLLSHATAVRKFRELKTEGEIRQDARIGIVTNCDFAYPLDPTSERDIATAERKMQYDLGWYIHPIVTGDYPEIMKQRGGDRLPKFTPEQSALLKGSYDLLMLNHYSSKLVTDCDSPTSNTPCDKLSMGWEQDKGVDDSRLPAGARPASRNSEGKLNCAWFCGYPPGYYDTIKWLHSQDPSADILLTENGWCGNDQVDNPDQLWYFQEYLQRVYRAVVEDHIPIIGYTAWSFLDNYEWGSFEPRFGLYYVNFTAQTGSKLGYTPKDTDLERLPRPAATWFAGVAQSKCLGAAASPVESPAQATTGQSPPVAPVKEESSWWPVVKELLVAVAALAAVVVVGGYAIRYVAERNSRGDARERAPLLSGRA